MSGWGSPIGMRPGRHSLVSGEETNEQFPTSRYSSEKGPHNFPEKPDQLEGGKVNRLTNLITNVPSYISQNNFHNKL